MKTLLRGLFLAGLAVLAGSSRGAADDDFKLEPGFTLLFNGKDLTGWKTKKGGDSLDNKTEAYNKRFVVSEGLLVIDPKVKGDVVIETAKSLAGDVHIKFDYLPGPGCNNDLFFRGHKFDLLKGNVKNLKEGAWNELEIVAQGKKVEFKNDGEVQRSVTAKVDATPLGIRAEFGPVQIRRIRIKAAD